MLSAHWLNTKAADWGPRKGGSAAGFVLFEGDAPGLHARHAAGPSSAMLLPAAQQVNTLAYAGSSFVLATSCVQTLAMNALG